LKKHVENLPVANFFTYSAKRGMPAQWTGVSGRQSGQWSIVSAATVMNSVRDAELYENDWSITSRPSQIQAISGTFLQASLIVLI